MFEFFKDNISIIFSLSLHLKLCHCPAKLWSNADFAPQNCKSFIFCPTNYRAFLLCPTKIWSNADFASQNHGKIVSEAKKNYKNYLKTRLSFKLKKNCKSMLFQRSIQQLGPLFKEQIFCVTVPLMYVHPVSISVWSGIHRMVNH